LAPIELTYFAVSALEAGACSLAVVEEAVAAFVVHADVAAASAIDLHSPVLAITVRDNTQIATNTAKISFSVLFARQKGARNADTFNRRLFSQIKWFAGFSHAKCP
jgi:hypothetical protein